MKMKKNAAILSGKLILDDEDLYWAVQWTWTIPKNQDGYAFRLVDHKAVLLHREIAKRANPEAEYAPEVDHKDGNKLNNRRSNLRPCTHAENMRNMQLKITNTSGYKGVCWSKRGQYWISYITVDYKTISLGCFDRKEDAAWAYNQAAVKHFGEFARLNEVPDWADGSSVRSRNTSGCRGVHFDKLRNVWVAAVYFNKKKHYLGSFGTVEEAQAKYLEHKPVK